MYPATNPRAISQLSAKQKTLETHHPDEERKPRLPDSIVQPIAVMPLSRMENTTFAMPTIIDSHDMGLRTVFSPDAQKKTPIPMSACLQDRRGLENTSFFVVWRHLVETGKPYSISTCL
ncbi:hypothetical protein TNCV_1365691 [Trichonephila clavipes]|nr:hypothetical protein TNCV_1365691 [Trichonephila clavipes]